MRTAQKAQYPSLIRTNNINSGHGIGAYEGTVDDAGGDALALRLLDCGLSAGRLTISP